MKELLTEKEICSVLGVNRHSLYYWRLQGMPYVTLGRVWLRYDLDVVRQWCKENAKKTNER